MIDLAALIGTDRRPKWAPSHPLGCRWRGVDDRADFDCVIAALVHGSGYERVDVPGSADRMFGTG